MSSRRPPRSPRTARSPELGARLERSRARSKRRRELARQKERPIQEAVKRYLTDWEAITACEIRRDQDIAVLREQISDLEARAGSEIVRFRADQAEAAAVIGDHGGSEEDVAELFEISDPATGAPSFARLQQRMHLTRPTWELMQAVPVQLFVFDLLELEDVSTMTLPYVDRRARLADLELTGAGVRVPPYWTDIPSDTMLDTAASPRRSPA